ncbi:conserved hypothetical protein [Cellulomonas flavigena DSM 20109]|uniref:Uncharacterized protein n=1 Tax=Cellulomonas flavigena (strain ATCC 482 / DSM 20109 / BCRC 11376 / JCM 18109 / NBRC 3775 / NCIMB 8073 / NRS 134) TaxID=446466 RepID=D5UIR4_CELFN|nr:hypothetical protein [Cellulomonas flavigena]ADG73563.1 conserved hypothetical protein [Cellulomonas flavigena DSM 20109]
MTTDRLTTTLRALDPADTHVDMTRARVRADLDTILATAPSAPATAPARPRAPRPRRTRVAVLAGAAAAAAAALVVAPPLTGGDTAFATWTAVPTALTEQESAAAAEACRDQVQNGAGEGEPALADARVAVSERRGDWTAVVLSGPGGFSALCLSDDSSGLFTGGMVGSVGVSVGSVDVGPRGLRATDLGWGSTGAGAVSLAAGHAGAEVTGVTYRSATHGDVVATVSEGRFALWLPGDELDGASTTGVEVEVTYVDGSTGTQTLTL